MKLGCRESLQLDVAVQSRRRWPHPHHSSCVVLLLSVFLTASIQFLLSINSLKEQPWIPKRYWAFLCVNLSSVNKFHSRLRLTNVFLVTNWNMEIEEPRWADIFFPEMIEMWIHIADKSIIECPSTHAPYESIIMPNRRDNADWMSFSHSEDVEKATLLALLPDFLPPEFVKV